MYFDYSDMLLLYCTIKLCYNIFLFISIKLCYYNATIMLFYHIKLYYYDVSLRCAIILFYQY